MPIAATCEHPKRVDYEYKRAGVANVFMFAEPLASWRQVSIRTQKTNELSCLTCQCVSGRRIGSEDELRRETTAWHNEINSLQRGVDWQMKIDDARVKLKSIYPKIKV